MPKYVAMKSFAAAILILTVFSTCDGAGYMLKEPSGPNGYYGNEIGPLTRQGSSRNNLRGVQGTFYVVDEYHIILQGFTYDGNGIDAYIWAGSSAQPDTSGEIIDIDFFGSPRKLRAYGPAYGYPETPAIFLRLPNGRRISDYRWISIWCRSTRSSYAEVYIPTALQLTGPQVIGSFNSLQATSGDVTIVDSRTIFIGGLKYDNHCSPLQGDFFWVGRGTVPGTPDRYGTFVGIDSNQVQRLPSQGIPSTGRGQDFRLRLSKGTDVFDIDYVALWCKIGASESSHGHVSILNTLSNVRPHTEGHNYGERIDKLENPDARVGDNDRAYGTVYAVDENTLQIVDFIFDQDPNAVILAGSSTAGPSAAGDILTVDGSTDSLQRQSYDHDNVIVKLPSGRTLRDYRWVAVYRNRGNQANLGWAAFPTYEFIPTQVKLRATLGFTPRVHDVYVDEVWIVDHQTFYLKGVDYDGYGPDAFFWPLTPDGVGREAAWQLEGDEFFREEKVPYDRVGWSGENVYVRLPDELTVYDITYLSIWCKLARQNFGQVLIPSRDELGLIPANVGLPPQIIIPPPPAPSPPQCEVLSPNQFHVTWQIDAARENVDITLEGRVEPGTYMAFGLSGSDTRTDMVGSDVAVAWIDPATQRGLVQDYYLQGRQQCLEGQRRGACPDNVLNNPDNIRLDGSNYQNGVSSISFSRPLNTGDVNGDKVIPLDRPVYISWAIGQLNPSGHVVYHDMRAPGDVALNFGREVTTTCPPLSGGVDPDLPPWPQTEIIAGTQVTTFRAEIGSAGGPRGYEGITGIAGWGIAWYLNEELIPILTLTRGVTYTFQVYGGNNRFAQEAANYHPMYITNDRVGGYSQNSAQENQGIVIYAGPVEGPLCEWTSTGFVSPDDYNSFAEFRDAGGIRRVCTRNGNPGILTFTPDANTPDTVYYQCYTHRYLGWKINVVDAEAPKQGTCPSTDGLVGICVELCSSDYDCGGDQKCCSNGCGHVCTSPTPPAPKPGTCLSTGGSAGICVELCSNDYDSVGDQKCCSNGCGHTCVPPAATDPCNPQPCRNGGQCIPVPPPAAIATPYVCICAAGFSGNNCENLNQCSNQPCLNGGLCIPGNGNSYSCACNDGYSGRHCDMSTQSQCEFEGVQYTVGQTRPHDDGCNTCGCTQNGWMCTQVPCLNPCSNQPCQNGGRCIPNGNMLYLCICYLGFRGTNCEINFDECSSNPCVNGQCFDGANTYDCTCDPGWTGFNCDEQEGVCPPGVPVFNCFVDPCQFATCPGNTNARCVSNYCGGCNADFYVGNVQLTDQQCNPSSQICIYNGQTYQHEESWQATDGCNTCSCLYGNVFCSLRPCFDEDDCASNPCVNGECVDGTNTYDCDCNNGWYGQNCDQQLTCSAGSDREVPVGESWYDGCNTCTCTDIGFGLPSADCTQRYCSPCFYENGVSYSAGDTWPATDGCNTCTCGDDGTWSCTERACVDPECVNANDGLEILTPDPCETCNCFGGRKRCYIQDCPAPPENCVINIQPGQCCHSYDCGGVCRVDGDTVYTVGQTWYDGCNTCSCTGGSPQPAVICTARFCPPCFYVNGDIYSAGDSWPAADGCNTCTCGEDGIYSCTETACGGCQQAADQARENPFFTGGHIPQCTDRFEYEPIQCQLGDECWCVDDSGVEIPGSRRYPGQEIVCRGQVITDCQREYRQLVSALILDAFVPRCTASGAYEPKQCYGFIGQCWCVDENGVEIPLTRGVSYGQDEVVCDGGNSCFDDFGNPVAHGQDIRTSDACTTCTCDNGRRVDCRSLACSPPGPGCRIIPDGSCCGRIECNDCHDDTGLTYPEGHEIPTSDPCTTCRCVNGERACVSIACAPPGPGCRIIPDGSCCGNIQCNGNGQCRNNNGTYNNGQSRPAGDGCNTCTCENGNWQCTLFGCGGMCPNGIQQVNCFVDPCTFTNCNTQQNATCRPNYCGGCNAEFYDLVTGRQLTSEECGVPCPPICDARYDPVCASDGRTYPNLCSLRRQSCTSNVPMTVVHSGPCLDTNCPGVCTQEYDPVCGSNGVTYGNRCELGRAACVITGLTLAYHGACIPTGTCQNACTREYRPVCGSDGRTYSNICELRREACNYHPDLVELYSGECRDGECPQACSTQYMPVCGSNGRTYPNLCTMRQETCTSGQQIEFVHLGECETSVMSCATSPCQNGGTCQDMSDGAFCTCPPGFSGDRCQRPATSGCIRDGRTYPEGQSVPADDGCNRCTCRNGGWICTTLACPPRPCNYNGRTYAAGESRDADDGCNTCYCSADGQWGCTETGCVDPCTYSFSGTPIPTSNPCETCECQNGERSCVRTACAPPPEGCVAVHVTGQCCPRFNCTGPVCHDNNGNAVNEGEEIPMSDPCLTCHCRGGQRLCSSIACAAPPPGCIAVPVTGQCCPSFSCGDNFCQDFNGNSINNGQIVPSTDSCETCRCRNGQQFCVRRSEADCPVPPPNCIPVPTPGMCCPSFDCGGTCMDDFGNTVTNGQDIPTSERCTTCQCSEGRRVCASLLCPAPPDENCARIPDGECCPRYECGGQGQSSSCDVVTTVPDNVRKSLDLDSFYQKYTEAYGIPILSSANVADDALHRACYVVRFLLADREDVRLAMYLYGSRVAVIGIDEETTDIPEHSWLDDSYNIRARGLGGTLFVPVSSAGEENLLCLGPNEDRYHREDIMIHELSHAIHLIGMNLVDDSFQASLEAAFDNAADKGLWRQTYASSPVDEYFAEGVQSFFNVNIHSDFADGVHNNISTREALRTYDPELFGLISAVFPCHNDVVKRCQDQSLIASHNFRMNCQDRYNNPVTCRDAAGRPINEGVQIGMDDPCLMCHCEQGERVCLSYSCIAPPHERCRPIQIDGQCCADEFDCDHLCFGVASGQRIPSSNPCQICSCFGNAFSCAEIDCPQPPPGAERCRPSYSDDQCCPSYDHCTVCTNDAGFAINEGLPVPTDNPCEDCTCRGGELLCAVYDCLPPPVGAENCPPIHEDGQCCPSYDHCLVCRDANFQPINEGVVLPSRHNPCQSCTCFRGDPYCSIQSCPRTPNIPIWCVPRPIEGECCPSYDHCSES